jgi:catechol 2,3-dioxygenase-like lactoylglutathione lyase family enzyme
MRRYFSCNEPECAVADASHGQYVKFGICPARAEPPRMRRECLPHDGKKEGLMAIVLNHTIVPAKDNRTAARFFADIFGLSYDLSDDHGHFAPVRVNNTLTLLFDTEEPFESHHYAFHVSDAEFDAILQRVRRAGISYGSAPWSIADGKLNDWGGGRGVYFKDPNGHVLELMTVPQ